MNIMLIDDDEAIRDMLQDIIEDYELGTVVASLPSAAKLTTAELVARHIDLLIIDMLMPDCDGIDSVRRFHDFPGKIIMISQVDSKDLIGKAYESGVYSYITKPLNRNEIVSVLRSVEEYIRLERFAHTLQSTQQTTLNPAVAVAPAKEVTPQQKAASLLKELGRYGKPVLLKRGMSATIDELLMSAEYIMSEGNDQVMLCERGIRTFETRTRNTFDVSAIPVLRELTHLPIIADPSHATGYTRFVTPVACAATAAQADGLEVEVHHDPAHAASDGAQALLPEQFEDMMRRVGIIRSAVTAEW